MDKQAVKAKFSKITNRFMFFLAIEEEKPRIIDGVRQGLADISPAKFRDMLNKGEFFELPTNVVQELQGYDEQIKYVKAQLIGELFGEARPDLLAILVEDQQSGGAWLRGLHRHLIDSVLQPAPVEVPTAEPCDEMVGAECPHCHNSWPVPKKDFDKIEKCPFCGTGRDTPDPPPPPPQTQ